MFCQKTERSKIFVSTQMSQLDLDFAKKKSFQMPHHFKSIYMAPKMRSTRKMTFFAPFFKVHIHFVKNRDG